MLKTLIFTFLLLSCLSIYSQNIKTKNNKIVNRLDSCTIFKKILNNKWIYHEKGNYFIDSLDLFLPGNSTPALMNCLKNKSKNEIKELFGNPSTISESDSICQYHYCLTPFGNSKCCPYFYNFEFNKKEQVFGFGFGGCHSQ